MIGLIWAQSANGVIGRDGDIPWSLPDDLAHFRDVTIGSTVIMGRNTWDSLPPFARPLPGRRNIVVTSNLIDGAETFQSLDGAIAAAGAGEMWVIGGQRLYRAAIGRADRLEVTELRGNFTGDTFAPTISDDFALVSLTDWVTGSSPKLDHRFRQYIRTSRTAEQTICEVG
jgi:dihydrofolate reductase